MKIKIYLKSQKRPIQIIVDKKEQADAFFDKIQANVPIVKFGNFVFNMNDFMCAIYEEI